MRVSEVMTRDPLVANAAATIRDAAMVMVESDIGSMPVTQAGRLVGIITDRDIAVRAVALGRGPDTLIADVMTSDVWACNEDSDLSAVSREMADAKVRRIPVVDRNGQLVGVLALGDLATDAATTDNAADALRNISEPGGRHSQTPLLGRRD